MPARAHDTGLVGEHDRLGAVGSNICRATSGIGALALFGYLGIYASDQLF